MDEKTNLAGRKAIEQAYFFDSFSVFGANQIAKNLSFGENGFLINLFACILMSFNIFSNILFETLGDVDKISPQ